MNIGGFIKDKMVVILLNVLVFIILAGILLTANVRFIIILFVFCIRFFPLISYVAIEFIRYKNYYNEINGILENLEEKYLFPEVVKKANFIHGEKLNAILKEVSRDMQLDYREYIERWVHEIKTQIASTELIIENNQNEVTNKIESQMDRIEGFVEQVLYYSRSSNVNKDYMIKPINLDNIVRNVIALYKNIRVRIYSCYYTNWLCKYFKYHYSQHHYEKNRIGCFKIDWYVAEGFEKDGRTSVRFLWKHTRDLFRLYAVIYSLCSTVKYGVV